MRIEILSGSPRVNSVTRRVALHLQSFLATSSGHEIGLLDLADWDLPFMQSVFTSVQNTPDEWKPRIMHACGFECQFLPGILDGHPFPVGFRSSQLTKKQMSALIDWMQAWGDEQGIRWSDPAERKAA